MAIQLTVNGETFLYPENRDSAGWGEEATSWAVAVTNVLSNVNGTGDILQSIASINNNQAVATDIIGLNFDPTQVGGAVVEYKIYRSTNSAEQAEAGVLSLVYKPMSASWDTAQSNAGTGGVIMTVTSVGQVQYTSDNMSGTGYSGSIRFRAKALLL